MRKLAVVAASALLAGLAHTASAVPLWTESIDTAIDGAGSVAVVPEPAAAILAGLGLLGLAIAGRPR